MPSIAILGAGCSGLAAAHTLRDAGYTVVLYEKKPGVGGRIATYQQQGFIYDSGAQYMKSGAPSSVSLITERFNTPDFINISKPVWTFDGTGHIQPGDAEQNAEPRWSYRHGLTTLPKLMAEGLDIRTETRIASIRQEGSHWLLFDSFGKQLDSFQSVLITLPAPQALELVQSSTMAPDLQEQIRASLGQVRYNPLISVILGYRPRPQPRPYYALVNIDKAHTISWLAWEHEKAPERAPVDAGLLIAQMAPQYSLDHRNTADAVIFRDVAAQVIALIDEVLPPPFFTDIQRWSYALPASKVNGNDLNALTIPAGLAFCGDTFVGGRLHLALENGIMLANQLIATA